MIYVRVGNVKEVVCQLIKNFQRSRSQYDIWSFYAVAVSSVGRLDGGSQMNVKPGTSPVLVEPIPKSLICTQTRRFR